MEQAAALVYAHSAAKRASGLLRLDDRKEPAPAIRLSGGGRPPISVICRCHCRRTDCRLILIKVPEAKAGNQILLRARYRSAQNRPRREKQMKRALVLVSCAFLATACVGGGASEPYAVGDRS